MASTTNDSSGRKKMTPEEKLAEKEYYGLMKLSDFTKARRKDAKKEATKKFQAHVKGLIQYNNTLFKLAKKLAEKNASAEKGKKYALQTSAGKFTTSDVNDLLKQFNGKIDEMRLFRKYANKRIRDPNAAKGQDSIKLAIITIDGTEYTNLVDFFREALKAGFLDSPKGERPNIETLVEKIMEVDEDGVEKDVGPHLTTDSILTSLFAIFFANRDLQNGVDEKGRKVDRRYIQVKRSELFMKYFGETMADMTATVTVDKGKSTERKTQVPLVDAFGFIYRNKIVSLFTTKRDQFSAEQLADLDANYSARLRQESDQLMRIKQEWKTLRDSQKPKAAAKPKKTRTTVKVQPSVL